MRRSFAIFKSKSAKALRSRAKNAKKRCQLALQDFDCTTEGRELYLCVAIVDGPEEALGQGVARRTHIVAVRNYGRLVHDVTIERSGADVEGVGRRKADFDCAAVVLQDVYAAAREAAI